MATVIFILEHVPTSLADESSHVCQPDRIRLPSLIFIPKTKKISVHYLFSRHSLHISKKTPPSISPPIKTNERKMCVRWVLTISYTNFWLMEFFRRLKKNFLCDYHNKNRPGFLLCTLRFFFYLSERIHRYYTHTHTQVPFSCVCVHAEASPH